MGHQQQNPLLMNNSGAQSRQHANLQHDQSQPKSMNHHMQTEGNGAASMIKTSGSAASNNINRNLLTDGSSEAGSKTQSALAAVNQQKYQQQ